VFESQREHHPDGVIVLDEENSRSNRDAVIEVASRQVEIFFSELQRSHVVQNSKLFAIPER
jgi:hypothetical protein